MSVQATRARIEVGANPVGAAPGEAGALLRFGPGVVAGAGPAVPSARRRRCRVLGRPSTDCVKYRNRSGSMLPPV
ncbi:hypothetical protein [Gordonia sp. NPDC003950]